MGRTCLAGCGMKQGPSSNRGSNLQSETKQRPQSPGQGQGQARAAERLSLQAGDTHTWESPQRPVRPSGCHTGVLSRGAGGASCPPLLPPQPWKHHSQLFLAPGGRRPVTCRLSLHFRKAASRGRRRCPSPGLPPPRPPAAGHVVQTTPRPRPWDKLQCHQPGPLSLQISAAPFPGRLQPELFLLLIY